MIKRIARELVAALGSLDIKFGSYSELMFLNNVRLIDYIAHSDEGSVTANGLAFDGIRAALLRSNCPWVHSRREHDASRKCIIVERDEFIDVLTALAQNVFDEWLIEQNAAPTEYKVVIKIEDEPYQHLSFFDLREAIKHVRDSEARKGFEKGIIYDAAYNYVYKTVGYRLARAGGNSPLKVGRERHDARLIARAVKKAVEHEEVMRTTGEKLAEYRRQRQAEQEAERSGAK